MTDVVARLLVGIDELVDLLLVRRALGLERVGVGVDLEQAYDDEDLLASGDLIDEVERFLRDQG